MYILPAELDIQIPKTVDYTADDINSSLVTMR